MSCLHNQKGQEALQNYIKIHTEEKRQLNRQSSLLNLSVVPLSRAAKPEITALSPLLLLRFFCDVGRELLDRLLSALLCERLPDELLHRRPPLKPGAHRRRAGVHRRHRRVERGEALVGDVGPARVVEAPDVAPDVVAVHAQLGRYGAGAIGLGRCVLGGELGRLFRLLPKKLEDPLHAPDGEDLGLDLLPTRGEFGGRHDDLGRVRGRRLHFLSGRPELFLRADSEDGEEHLDDLSTDEGQRPGERVHEVGQPIRVGGPIVLPDRHGLVRIFQHSAAISVDVEVVGSRENGDDGRELLVRLFAMHGVPSVLCLVPSDDREQAVPLQKFARSLERVKVRAAAHLVVQEERAGRVGGALRPGLVLVPKVGDRVRPEQVAEQAVRAGLLEAVQPSDVFQRDELGRDPTVHAEEAAVDEGGYWEGEERAHGGFVYCLRVFVYTFALERKVFCQVSALVVAPEE